MRGRPLAFLFLVVTGWGIVRFAVLLPADVTRPFALVSEEVGIPSALADVLPPVVAQPFVARPRAASRPLTIDLPGSSFHRLTTNVKPQSVIGAAAPPRGLVEIATTATVPVRDVAPAGLPQVLPTASGSDRWSGSAWLIARDGGGGVPLSPLLGGAQAGARLAYQLDEGGRTALFAKVAAPLKDGPAELGIGAQWQPTKVLVTAYAEMRATRGRVAPVIGVFGGGSAALPAKFRLEGYGQAGAIRRDGISGFGDGQVRLARRVGPIEAGAGAWAAVQRGTARLDVGPSLALPIATDPATLRLTLDWRYRVAGNARPASGPALSLGADF